MALSAQLLLRRGDFTLDASVRVEAGETLALLGPNGSGKSTLLAAIAGLLVPERGAVEVDGRILTSVGSVSARPRGRARVIAPHERRVGLLGQDPLLFPHLTALENVAFGPRARGESAARARAAASGWLEAVGLADFASRRPGQLSGGQQQRVAIARALAAEPEVLLLDEPMAALDVQNASAVRTLLRERLRATALPTIVVSHDVVDALVLADRVAIMDNGRIIDVGEPALVLGRPVNRFAANLVGLNLLQGTLESDGTVLVADGRRLCGTVVEDGVGAGVSLGAGAGAGARALRAGDPVMAAFPPSALRVALAVPDVLCVLEAPDGPGGPNGRDEPGGPDGPHAEGAVGRAGEAGSAGKADVTSSEPGANSWRATVGVLEPAARGIRIPFVGDDLVAEATTAELLSSGVHQGAAVTVTVEPKFVTVCRARRGAGAMQG